MNTEINHYHELSDETLILRYQNGEVAVQDYLLEKYKDLVRRRARAMYLMGQDTDDLIQEGMIGLFKAVRDYQPGRSASFLTFATLCVDRQLITAVQNSNRQKNIPLNFAVPLEPEGEIGSFSPRLQEENPEAIIIDQENRADLEQLISEELSPMEKEVLEHYLSGETYTSIGEQMGRSAKSIDNALQRIRRKISQARNVKQRKG